MILVVEGANKVGKSTIINNLKLIYGEENVINVYERQEHNEILQRGRKMFKYVNFAVGLSNIRYLEILEKMDPTKLYILDRFHLTELVYGEFYRRYNAFDTFVELDTLLSKANAKLFLVQSKFNHIKDIDEIVRLTAIQDYMKVAFEKSTIKGKLNFTFSSEFELGDLSVLHRLVRLLEDV
jgi:nicotinamide riboside kinase